jgi:type III secretion protein T
MLGLTPERITELYAAGQMLLLAAARPMGFTLLFTAFAWGHLNSGILRIAFAIAIALPVMAPLWLTSHTTMEMLPQPFVVLILKELLIGIIIGFLLSLPFEAMGAAGSIVDNYRGSGVPLMTPGGEATPFGQVFIVVTLWMFASLDGFFIVVDVIYATYGIWPMTEPIPRLTTDGLMAFFHFLTRLLKLAAIVAGPMLVLLAVVDLVFAISAKIGKQINVTFLSMGVKALVAVIALPPFALVLVRIVQGEVKALAAFEPLLRAAIR